MKRLLKLFALAVMLVGVTANGFAQKRVYRFDSSHNSLFSNWNIGAFGQYSNYHGKSGIGLGFIATKQVHDLVYFRYEAAVNGLKVTEGFDRYGTAMAGTQFNFLEWMYIFGDLGAVYNPTMAQKFGLAADAGLGFNVNFGKHSMLRLEGGSDLVQNNTALDNTFFVRLGYSVRTGITESDRQAIDIDWNVREGYGNLKQENQLLKSEAKKKEEEYAKMADLLERSTAALELATQRLDNCQTEKKEIAAKAAYGGDFEPIRFEFASSYLDERAEAQCLKIARAINADETDAMYAIEGWCSANGDPYKNQKLSEDRAMSVLLELKRLGVDSTRLYIVGNGMGDEDSVLEQKVVVRKTF